MRDCIIRSFPPDAVQPENGESTLENIQMDAQDDGMSLRGAEHRVLTSAEYGAGDPAQIIHARYSCNCPGPPGAFKRP